ncbi:MAG: acyl-CoA dehydrogenase family protein [Thermodesulfobacteriota bacterium]
MDFEPTDEHKAFRDRARRFAEAEIRPGAADMDAGRVHPAALIRQLGQEKLMGVAAPAEDGGCGLDPVSYVLGLMEVSRACASAGALMFVQNSLYGFPLVAHGNPEQKKRYLHPCTRGEAIGAFVLPATAAGSGLSDLHTTAVRTHRGWDLKGGEPRVAGGGLASFCMLPALGGTGKREGEISLFAVDLRETPGFKKGPEEVTFGLSGLGSAGMMFERAEVPAEAVVGNPGEGRAILRRLRARGWVGAAALALGIGRAVQEESLRHAKPILSVQGVQWRLADMATELDAGELLVMKAAWLEDRGKPFEREAAMACMAASEGVMKSSIEGLQMMGEEGCAKGSPMERHMRDAKMCQILHGPHDTMRSVVSGHLVPGAKRSS